MFDGINLNILSVNINVYIHKIMLKKDQGFKFGFQRLAELKALKDQNKRVFGKEITNLNKRSKNFSIHEGPSQKVEQKPRAVSFKKYK